MANKEGETASFDRSENEDKPLVNLCDGIDRNQLIPGKDIDFEIDPSSISNEENENIYFDQEDVFQQLNMECLDLGDGSSEDESITPFIKMLREMHDISPAKDGGLHKKVMKAGVGSVVNPNSQVKVHYNGYLEYSDEPFDSSRLRGRPITFRLGRGETIKAWDIGVATMRKGELSRLIATHEYAYGAMGCPPRIPRNATVMFEIELISFFEPSDENERISSAEDRYTKVDFPTLLQKAIASKESGNEAYQENRTMLALKHYLKGLRMMEDANMRDQDDEAKMKEISKSLCLNTAQCHLKLKDGRKAAKFSRKALYFDPKCVRAHYRLGKALKMLGEFTDSKKHLLIAQNKLPGNKEIMAELKDLDIQAKKFKLVESQTFASMLSLKPKTTASTEEEKKTEIPNSQVSEEMIQLIEERIKMFVGDDSLNELPLQAGLTISEITMVKEIAARHELDVTETKEGSRSVFKLRKRQKQGNNLP